MESIPFDSSYIDGVAKVYLGNSAIGSGAFISEQGLFLTTLEPVLSLISQNTVLHPVLNGFSAEHASDEIPISGLSLLVLIEERDVTDVFTQQIPSNATNNQIARLKRQISQNIIQKERGDARDLLVQVTDIYSGNNQILSIYKILNDVRLVWTGGLGISESELSNSNLLLQKAEGKTSLLRAYVQPDGSSAGHNLRNVPFSPEYHFELMGNLPEDQKVLALGFPERTFRSESFRALTFYNTITNSSILDAYEPLQHNLDISAEEDFEFANSSLYQRYNAAAQVRRYNQIQDILGGEELIDLKSNEQFDFELWLTNDSTGNNKYRDIFAFINQAYDIAEQNGSSFFATSYAINLGRIDDFANQIKQYYEQSDLAQTDEELEQIENTTFQNINQLLQTVNIDSELKYLSYSLESLNNLPEEQKIPSLDALFANIPEDKIRETALAFLERQKSSTFLFDVTTIRQALEDGTTFDDSLFVVLDEILFVNDMNRNNHAIYLAYLQPAQQVFVEATIAKNGIENVPPDANGTLRYNEGFFRKAVNSGNPDFIISYNDFSANSSGTPIITLDGKLLGITDADNSTSPFSNYMFRKEDAHQKSTNIAKLFRTWRTENVEAGWFSELGADN